MSHFKTVLDFLSGVPAALKHEELYIASVSAKPGEEAVIDLRMWEESAVGLGEMNLLRDFPIVEKFTCPNMDEEMKVVSCSLAKQKGKAFGKGSLSNEVEYVETYKMPKAIQLRPRTGLIFNAGRKQVVLPENEPLYRRMSASLEGACPVNLSGPALSYIGERLVARHDLRHLFLKGYLSVMAYNLAIVSERSEYDYNLMRIDIKKGCVGEKKLSAMMAYQIVVDLNHFTAEEVWLLAEMSNKFPSRKYHEWNIYNHLLIEEDVIGFITDDMNYKLDDNPGYGSPERMWNDLVNIAVKMDALEDLREVVRDFRGVPGLLRSVNSFTGKDQFELTYPKSYSLLMAVESLNGVHPMTINNSGYFATSKNLVVDLMLSRLMEVSVYNMIEENGGLGDVCVPTKDAVKDSFYDSVLRNWGLKIEKEESNILLQEWRGVRGCAMPVSFGGKLKNYVQRMTKRLRRGDEGVVRPQLLHALPFSSFRNTTWAMIRGWRFQEFNFRDTMDDRIISNQKLKAFTWVMGVCKSLPKVGLNAIGNRLMDAVSVEEHKYLSLAAGDYELGLVRHVLGGEMHPRTDEFEMSMGAFYTTSFPGTRCTIVFDATGAPSVVQEEKTPFHISTIGMKEAPKDSGEVTYTYGGSPVPEDKKDKEGGDWYDPGGKGSHRRRGGGRHGSGRGRGDGGRGRGNNEGRWPPPPPPVDNRKPLEKKKSPGGDERTKQEEATPEVTTLPVIEPPAMNVSNYPPLDTKNARDPKGRVDDSGVGHTKPEISGTEEQPAPEEKVKKIFPQMKEQKSEKWGDMAEEEEDLNKKLAGKELQLKQMDHRLRERLGFPEDPEYDGRKQVVASLVNKIPYRAAPIVRAVDGVLVGHVVELHDGTKAEIALAPGDRVPLNPDNIRGYRVKTMGDGTCGIHAIVQDWMLKGYTPISEADGAYKLLQEMTGSDTWHEAVQLAGAVNCVGHGFVLIDGTHKKVHEYGVAGADEITYVYYTGNHFETFIPHDKGNFQDTGYTKISSELTPAEAYEGAIAFQAMLKGDLVANVMMENALTKVRRTATGAAHDLYQEAIARVKDPAGTKDVPRAEPKGSSVPKKKRQRFTKLSLGEPNVKPEGEKKEAVPEKQPVWRPTGSGAKQAMDDREEGRVSYGSNLPRTGSASASKGKYNFGTEEDKKPPDTRKTNFGSKRWG